MAAAETGSLGVTGVVTDPHLFSCTLKTTLGHVMATPANTVLVSAVACKT